MHEAFGVSDLLRMTRLHPQAITIVHLKCPANIGDQSADIGGTQGMLKHVRQVDDHGCSGSMADDSVIRKAVVEAVANLRCAA